MSKKSKIFQEFENLSVEKKTLSTALGYETPIKGGGSL